MSWYNRLLIHKLVIETPNMNWMTSRFLITIAIQDGLQQQQANHVHFHCQLALNEISGQKIISHLNVSEGTHPHASPLLLHSSRVLSAFLPRSFPRSTPFASVLLRSPPPQKSLAAFKYFNLEIQTYKNISIYIFYFWRGCNRDTPTRTTRENPEKNLLQCLRGVTEI